MYEIETKILGVSGEAVAQKLAELSAEKIQDTKLVVDWYRKAGWRAGEDEWYLRIRTYSDGKSEVTWKGKSDKLGASRSHKEINVLVTDPEKMSGVFEAVGLIHYAHQEKFRKSWKLRDWQFDLDQYPNMPAYLEIEGSSEGHIQEAIGLLSLQGLTASPEGERVLIESVYHLNWHDMRFKT